MEYGCLNIAWHNTFHCPLASLLLFMDCDIATTSWSYLGAEHRERASNETTLTYIYNSNILKY